MHIIGVTEVLATQGSVEIKLRDKEYKYYIVPEEFQLKQDKKFRVKL